MENLSLKSIAALLFLTGFFTFGSVSFQWPWPLSKIIRPAVVPTATPVPPIDNRLNIVPVQIPTATLSYPVYNSGGSKIGDIRWRVAGNSDKTTGNCCENYLTVAPDGTILDLGGGLVHFTTDRGVTWNQARLPDIVPDNLDLGPLWPGKVQVGNLPSPLSTISVDFQSPSPIPLPLSDYLNNLLYDYALFGQSEGAIGPAPGGDIVGFTWVVRGDRLFTYKYSAQDRTWRFHVAALSTPLSDRPWIAVAKGPFLVNKKSYPYVVILKAGYPFKDILYLSFDGLNYTQVSYPDIEQLVQAPTVTTLDLPDDPDADWLQTNARTLIYPLAGGRAVAWYGTLSDLLRQGNSYLGELRDYLKGVGKDLVGVPLLRTVPLRVYKKLPVLERSVPISSCPWVILNGAAKWSCLQLTRGLLPQGLFQTDSRGYLYRAYDNFDGKTSTLVYEYSTDGARTWKQSSQRLPTDWEIEHIDLKINGGLDLAAVLIGAKKHANNDHHQFMVYKISSAASNPRIVRMHLGKGDFSFGSSSSDLGPRYDFASVGILPDGKLVASFGDSDHLRPSIAIEQ